MTAGVKVTPVEETPNGAYQRGRAEAIKEHRYRTVEGETGAHCMGCEDHVEDIGEHVEVYAEARGVQQREQRVHQLAKQHTEREIEKAKKEAEAFRARGGITIP